MIRETAAAELLLARALTASGPLPEAPMMTVIEVPGRNAFSRSKNLGRPTEPGVPAETWRRMAWCRRSWPSGDAKSSRVTTAS